MSNISKTYLLADTCNTACLTDCLTENLIGEDGKMSTDDGTSCNPSPEAVAAMRAALTADGAEMSNNNGYVAPKGGNVSGHAVGAGQMSALMKQKAATEALEAAVTSPFEASTTGQTAGTTTPGGGGVGDGEPGGGGGFAESFDLAVGQGTGFTPMTGPGTMPGSPGYSLTHSVVMDSLLPTD